MEITIIKETRNDKGHTTYREWSNGDWYKYEYDHNGNKVYGENSKDGYWSKRQYDTNGNNTYYENSHGKKIIYF